MLLVAKFEIAQVLDYITFSEHACGTLLIHNFVRTSKHAWIIAIHVATGFE